MSLALADLYVALIQRFDSDELTGVQFAFGWRVAAEHTAGAFPRVCFVPGDDSDAVGDTSEPDAAGTRDVDGNRILGRLQQLCRVIITAAGDLQRPDDELRQWRATMELRNAVWSRMKSIGSTQLAVISEKYLPASARLSDVTIQMVIGVFDQVTDDASGIAYLHADGDVQQTLGDTTEVYAVP